jgi:hypothetical protein
LAKQTLLQNLVKCLTIPTRQVFDNGLEHHQAFHNGLEHRQVFHNGLEHIFTTNMTGLWLMSIEKESRGARSGCTAIHLDHF